MPGYSKCENIKTFEGFPDNVDPEFQINLIVVLPPVKMWNGEAQRPKKRTPGSLVRVPGN